MKEIVVRIEIDCAPGPIRPDFYLPIVLESANLTVSGKEQPVSRFFGNWVWVLPMKVEDDFDVKLAGEKIHDKQEELYNAGRIRYASIDID